MSSGRRNRVLGVAAVIAVSVAVALVACSNGGEGDRCQTANGNDDCQDGLVCIPASPQQGISAPYGYVNAPFNTSDRCCPADRSTATHPACTSPQGGGSDAEAPDSAPPGDAGDASSDAASDASDAETDAASDASDADADDGD